MIDRLAAALCCTLALTAVAGCGRGDDRVEVAVGPRTEQKLARSLGIVRTATAENPKVLKLLFYGQSISQRKWTDQAVAHLQAQYPNVRFVVRNMAIGGFASPLLERTAARDLSEFYPDLIVFHVYGDHRAYERIIRTMRSLTTAEVIVQTDHVVQPVEPVCLHRVYLGLHPPPGCAGFLLVHQRDWDDYMSGYVEPELARRYGLAIEPRRRAWDLYLRRHGLAPEALLADPPHPNDAGWRLMARLFDSYFDQIAARWHGETQTMVEDRPLPADGARFRFTGNRLELIASAPLDGKVEAMVDGKSPQALDGCWQTSRTSVLPGVPDWPAIRQVTVDATFHRAERWTATVTRLNQAQDDFTFRIDGATTGPDGTGSGRQDFTSPSGRIRIAAKDWVIPDGVKFHQQRVPEGFRVSWDHHFVCGADLSVPLKAGRVETRYVVATGLANGPHEVMLRLAPGARSAIEAARTFRPPLVSAGT